MSRTETSADHLVSALSGDAELQTRKERVLAARILLILAMVVVLVIVVVALSLSIYGTVDRALARMLRKRGF